jgi:uncharacterized protein (DUF1330 family)
MTDTTQQSGRGYIYVEMAISNWEGFRAYTALSAPAVHAAGGRYLIAGVTPECLEGEFEADRVVVVEFDTPALAREFYHSARYQAAKEKRRGAARFKMLLLEGTTRGKPALRKLG